MANPKASMLVVDDSVETLEVLSRNLAAAGYQVRTAPAVHEALRVLETAPVDLVITDLRMPKQSGMELVRHVRENLPDAAVMMVTGHATIETAVQAVKSGAEEYLTKPFTDDELLSAVARVLDKLEACRAARRPRAPETGSRHGMIGGSRGMKGVHRAIAKIAKAPATVLVTGESGVGKELVARAIHYASPRASAPFVPVNCGAIPEQLLESELFGHVKGAFTGAMTPRTGFFEAAHGGTIFLDEISELAPAAQVKLLRVLQQGEVLKVGSSQARAIDVRIVAASNKDLRVLVEKGTFREDLFFRVSVINIDVPPLRSRDDDIPLLVSHFMNKYSIAAGRRPPALRSEALAALQAYHWPGNVRELENAVNRLVVMCESDVIDVSDLPERLRYRIGTHARCDRTLAQMEHEYVTEVLASVGGNKTRAAQILGIDRKTLRDKLKPPAQR